jgi:hypothetical protein
MLPLPLSIKSIASIAAILAVFGATWYVRGMKADIDQQAALQAQRIEIVAQCEADKELTSKIGKEYEEKISSLSSRVAALKRLSARACVSVTSPTGKPDDGTKAGHAGVDAVDSGVLIDYAAEAEKYRQQLISLQEFVRKAQSR